MKLNLFIGLLLTKALIYSSKAVSQCNDVAKVSGTGHLQEVKWSYDKASEVCTLFLYKGNSNSSNLFASEKECLESCAFGKYQKLYPDGVEKCNLTKERGPCMALIVMWYYDYEKQACDTFLYGGCQGNGNRFSGWKECHDTCKVSRSGRMSFTAQNDVPPSSSTSEGVIIGAVCACIFGMAFIVTLAVFFVQRKKQKQYGRNKKQVESVEMK